VLVGVLLRLTIRDHWFGPSILFYATPLPVLAVTAIIAAIAWRIQSRSRLAWTCMAAAVLCTMWWFSQSYRNHTPSASTPTLRVLMWNINWGYMGRRGAIERIKKEGGDLIAIAEAGRRYRGEANIYRHHFPDLSQSELAHGMLLLTRGRVLNNKSGNLGRKGRFLQSDVEIDDQRFTVLFVDITPSPTHNRREEFERLLPMIDALQDRPLIVMGDFNTPTDSVWIDKLRERLTNAFEEKGKGFSETWPMPLPVLAIDHVWVNDRIKLAGCSQDGSVHSDHQMVKVEIERIEPAR
jgi:endonuclease/exonuclease/phosphatase family metal-dependent hydrolase